MSGELSEFVRGILYEWLEDKMREISQEAYSAGWSIGLERSLWRGISELPGDYQCGFTVVNGATLDKMRKVAELVGAWPVWDDDSTEINPMPLDEWKRRFEAGAAT